MENQQNQTNEIQRLQNELERIKSTFTPEMMQVNNMQNLIVDLNKEINKLNNDIANLTNERNKIQNSMKKPKSNAWKIILLVTGIVITLFIAIVVWANIDIDSDIKEVRTAISKKDYTTAENLINDNFTSSTTDYYGLYSEIYLAQNKPEKAIDILIKGYEKADDYHREQLQSLLDNISVKYNIEVTLPTTVPETTKPTQKQPTKKENNETKPKKVKKKTSKKTNDYLNEIEWADLSDYMFAVEIDDFNGDIFESGKYRFYPDYITTGNGNVPIVWDIYVSDKKFSQLSQNELVATVGGIGNYETTIPLKKGQYVYIKYNDVVGNPTGLLKIEKTK